MIDFDFDKKINGSVRRIKEHRLSNATRQDRNFESRSSSMVTYSQRGSVTERIFYDEAGNEASKYYFEYNDADQLVKEKSYTGKTLNGEKFYADGLVQEIIYFKPDGSLWSKSRFLYDEKQRLIYTANCQPDGTISSRKEILYDKYGNRTEEELMDEFSRHADVTNNVKTASGFVLKVSARAPAIEQVKFDENNNPTSVKYFNADRELIKSYEILCDFNGLVRRVDEYLNQPGSQHPEVRMPNFLASIFFTAVSTYEYAKEGDITQSLKSLTDAPLESRTLYFWNRGGVLAGRHLFIFGKLSWVVEYSYGTRGELLKGIWSDGDKTVNNQSDLEWKFDEQDNWTEYVLTEESHYSNIGTSRSVTKVNRTIEYY